MIKYKSFRDISISKFYELQDILQSDLTDDDKNIRLVSFFCDIPEDDVLEMNTTKFNECLVDIKQIFLEQQDVKYKKPPKNIIICGEHYNIYSDVSKITVGQYLDFQNYSKEKNNFGKILSIFLIPSGKTYANGYDISKTVLDFEEHLDIITTKEICDFFILRLANLTNHTLVFFKLVMMMMTMKVKMVSLLTRMKTKLKKVIQF